MPLNRNRKLVGAMDQRIYIVTPYTSVSGTGGPRNETLTNGPYWASMEYLSRKQMETEVDTRITSIQQIRFTLRYSDAVDELISKAGNLRHNDIDFNIISVSKDAGREQFLQIVTELKE